MRLPSSKAMRRTLLGIGAAMLLAGCQLGTPRQQPGPAGTVVAPPAALGTLQSNAEAMIDSANAGDWTRVSAELAAVHQAWTSLRPDLAGRGARAGLLDSTDAALANLDRQANRLSVGGTSTAANRLTGFVPDMQTLYGASVPPQIAQMRFLAREVGNAAQAGQMTVVWDDARELGTAWAYVRPAAQKASVGDASQLDLQIAQLDAAVSQTMSGQSASPAMASLMPVAAAGTSASISAATSSLSSAGPSASSSATSSSAAAIPSSSSAAAPAPQRRRTTRPSFTVPSTTNSISPVAAAILDTLDALNRDFQALPPR